MLESWLRAPSTAQGLALRAKVILASAEGEGVRPLARRLGISPNTVAVWRRPAPGRGSAAHGCATLPSTTYSGYAGKPCSCRSSPSRTLIDLHLELGEIWRVHDEIDPGDLAVLDREHEGRAHLTAYCPDRACLAVDEGG
jgi:Helix-turn-helix domain